MAKPKLIIIFTSFLIMHFSVISLNSDTQFGTGVGISPWDTSAPKKRKRPKTTDTYVKVIAKYFKMNEDNLARLWRRGYGRNELIKLILISQRGGQEFKKLIKQRDKNIKLSRMAEKYKVDYTQILEDASRVRKEIDYEVSITTPTVSQSVDTSSFNIIIYSSEDQNKVHKSTGIISDENR